jgi:hypothetical protein
MPIGQLNEQTPHCTQRIGSGVTHAPASVRYFSLSAVKNPTASHRSLFTRRPSSGVGLLGARAAFGDLAGSRVVFQLP